MQPLAVRQHATCRGAGHLEIPEESPPPHPNPLRPLGAEREGPDAKRREGEVGPMTARPRHDESSARLPITACGQGLPPRQGVALTRAEASTSSSFCTLSIWPPSSA